MEPTANKQEPTSDQVNQQPTPTPIVLQPTLNTTPQHQPTPVVMSMGGTTDSAGLNKKSRKKLFIVLAGVSVLLIVGLTSFMLLKRDTWSAQTKQSFLSECNTMYAKSNGNFESQCKCMMNELVDTYTQDQLDKMNFSLQNLDSAAFSEVTKASANCQKS
jgi:hypothetical protein